MIVFFLSFSLANTVILMAEYVRIAQSIVETGCGFNGVRPC